VNDYERAIKYSKSLETLLKNRFGATGKGLHEYTSSVESKLDPKIVKKLRYMATIRNKLVHDDGYSKIDDRGRFIETYNEVYSALKPAGSRTLLYVVVILVILAAGYYAYTKYLAE
jgi:hypothetical protein